MTFWSLMQVLFGKQPCKRADVNPKIDETFQKVREQTHSAAGHAFATHALVERKRRSIQIAEDALTLMRGEELQ